MDAGGELLELTRAARVFPSRGALLRHCALAAAPGVACEFGVHTGGSLRAIRNFRKPPVFGFDSFTGLPSVWDTGGPAQHPAGHFACEPPRDLPIGVHLVVGLFEDTLSAWAAKHAEPVRFVHIDCDLYTSARAVFETLDAHIVAGTVLLFDELVDWHESGVYPNWREGEWRALIEWLAQRTRAVSPIGRTAHQQAAFVVTT